MALDDQEKRIVSTVEKFGWMVMQISPNIGDRDPRWFAYTVGLTVTHCWPEIICFGLPLDVMAKLINNSISELKNKALLPASGVELIDVAEAYPLRLDSFSVRHYREHLGFATWFAHHRNVAAKDFHCLQLVWPDKNGHYPFDAACNINVRTCQTPVGATH